MKQFSAVRFGASVWLMVLALTGCDQLHSLFSRDSMTGGQTLTVMTYNVENLFDAVSDGDEYPEYDPVNGFWDAAGYHLRLSRFSEVINELPGAGPDIILFQEIEHEGVLHDLVQWYLRDAGYDYRAATSVSGSAIEVGVISRFPIEEIIFHSGQIGPHRAPRPVMETIFTTPWGNLHVFNGHWKSKIGGAEATQTRRTASSLVIRNRTAEIRREDRDAYIVAGGDLNETPWESDDYETALRRYGHHDHLPHHRSLLLTADKDLVDSAKGIFYSPWLEPEGLNMEGTYLYRGNWEAIDHLMVCENFFSGEGLEYCRSWIVTEGLLDEFGGPKSWNLYARTGISDHLPMIMHGKVMDCY